MRNDKAEYMKVIEKIQSADNIIDMIGLILFIVMVIITIWQWSVLWLIATLLVYIISCLLKIASILMKLLCINTYMSDKE